LPGRSADVRQCGAYGGGRSETGWHARQTPVTGPILGAFADVTYEESEVRLGFDEVLFLYTDGVTEARRDGAFYGEERLCDFLSNTSDGSAKRLVEDVVADVLAFSGRRLTDDLAILAVKRLECSAEAPQQQKMEL
jgi:phosphoserine phosphatase RsbU/P